MKSASVLLVRGVGQSLNEALDAREIKVALSIVDDVVPALLGILNHVLCLEAQCIALSQPVKLALFAHGVQACLEEPRQPPVGHFPLASRRFVGFNRLGRVSQRRHVVKMALGALFVCQSEKGEPCQALVLGRLHGGGVEARRNPDEAW
jgi:hypothetical protein